MNLTLPVTIGLAWRAFTRPRQPLVRALWLTLAVISIVAVFSNTSRMSQALGAGILLVLAAGLFPKAFGVARARLEWPTAVAGGMAILLAFYAVVQTSRLDRAFASLGKRERDRAAGCALECGEGCLGCATRGGLEWVRAGDVCDRVPIFHSRRGIEPGGALDLSAPGLSADADGVGLGGGRVAGMDFFWRDGGGQRWEINAECGMRNAASDAECAKSRWTPRQRLFVPLVLLGLGSVALHALVDFPLQVASIQLYVATYLGVCWGSVRWGERVIR